jgi:archaellum component FlaF (FlaF/FlaG flagellin family)
VDAEVNDSWIQMPSSAIVLTSSILGPTTKVRINRTQAGSVSISGDVRDVAVDGAVIKSSTNKIERKSSAAAKLTFDLDLTSIDHPGTSRTLVVKPGDSIQKAVDALPLTGGDITVEPGTYREAVTIRKPHVHLHGSDPSKTTIVFNNGAVNHGGTFNSSTVFVEADDVTIDHLSIVNDLGSGKGQAVALHVTGDRAIFRNLRLSGAQDTLFAASRYCYGDYGRA